MARPAHHKPRLARSTRRRAALAALALSGLSAGGVAAMGGPATATTTTGPTTPGTTKSTTTSPATTAPRSTTPTTSGSQGSGGNGIPSVPTGGGTSATTAPGQTPAASDPSPIIAGVQADLDQLADINQVADARTAVTTATQAAATADTALGTAQAQQASANQAVADARRSLTETVVRLSSIAVAAYTGAAYGQSGAAPSKDPGQTKSAQSLVTGNTQVDADELMRLVTEQEKQNLMAARRTVAGATATLAKAAAGVRQAQKADGAAHDAETAAKATLTQTMQGATTAGAAAASQQGETTPGEAVTPGQSTTTTTPTTTAPTTAPQASGATTTIPGETPAGAAAIAQEASGHISSTGSSGGGTAGPGAAGASGVSGNEGSAPRILGPPSITAAEMAGWFKAGGHVGQASVPVTQLAVDYLAAGKATGVRGDLAFAQSIIETGYFAFPAGGQLTGQDNNFAGIGACDSCQHGWTFPNAITGVTAQEELLEAYASPTQVPTPLVGSVGVGGCCQTWIALAGTWATDPAYGISILTVYKSMLDYAIPEQLVAAGLKPPGSAPPLPAMPAQPAGPTLPASLPATGPSTTLAPKAPTLAPTGG